MISIVIPTYNEAAVIQETLRRAAAALRSVPEEFELIVVDDASADGTAELAEALSGELAVRVLRRPGRLGLATAVLDGWAIARGDALGVIDADLQHPPEALAKLAEALRPPDVDLAIGSRYVAGGGTSEWPWLRRFISWGATHLAACVLPLTLADVRDPMSGMFVVRRAALDGVELSPLGYKILLEVLAKGRYRGLVEVAYTFEQRGRGSSKLGPRQYVEYLYHLVRLARSTGQLVAWTRYGLVGLTGAAINLGALYWLLARAGWPMFGALAAAIQLALFSNFLWNEALTFRSVRRRNSTRGSALARLLRYEKVCLPGAAVNGAVTYVSYGQDADLLLAAAAGVFAGGLLNLLFNIPSIWRIWGARALPDAAQSA